MDDSAKLHIREEILLLAISDRKGTFHTAMPELQLLERLRATIVSESDPVDVRTAAVIAMPKAIGLLDKAQ